MESINITKGKINKIYLITTISENSAFSVERVELTNGDVISGVLEGFGIEGDERYPLLTYTEYVGDRLVTDMEIGDILSIDDVNCTITRLA